VVDTTVADADADAAVDADEALAVIRCHSSSAGSDMGSKTVRETTSTGREHIFGVLEIRVRHWRIK